MTDPQLIDEIRETIGEHLSRISSTIKRLDFDQLSGADVVRLGGIFGAIKKAHEELDQLGLPYVRRSLPETVRRRIDELMPEAERISSLRKAEKEAQTGGQVVPEPIGEWRIESFETE